MDIVYFELNNWFAGRDYPDAEPFLSWMECNKENKYYIQFREGIVEILNSNEEYRIDQSYANFFDVIYNNGGIGFKKELYYPGKVHIGPEGIILYEKSKEIGMKLSDSFDDVYNEYKSSIQES